MGLVSTSGWAGFFIQLGTFSKENHAVVYVGDGKIAEATTNHGVVISPVSKYENIIWNRWENLTDGQRTAIVRAVLSHIGDPYAFRAIIIIATRILGAPHWKWLEFNLAHDKGLICSELVAICYRAAGIDVIPDKPVYFITPSDLLYRLLTL
jgi:uncharacterized protein YycO